MKNTIDINSVIELFEHHARQLDQHSNATSLEAAIALLANWMAQENQWLTQIDRATLAAVGGILFKEQLERRMQARLVAQPSAHSVGATAFNQRS